MNKLNEMVERVRKINMNMQEEMRFNGPCYDPKHDQRRLTGQLLRVYDATKDGGWNTLDEIHNKTNDPHASISAQLRHLRKERFGSHSVEKRARGHRGDGLWEYRVVVNG